MCLWRVQCRQEQEAQLAELMAMLQQLPVLTTQAVDTATNKMLSDHINALMQPDKLNIIRSNGKLVGTCSQCLCAALWQAAVSHKFNYHGPLVKMYRYDACTGHSLSVSRMTVCVNESCHQFHQGSTTHQCKQ